MQTITSNMNLFPWQKDFIRGVFAHRRNCIHVLKSPRQSAKSTTAELIILKYAVDNKTYNLWVSPTLRQARKVFREIKEAICQSTAFLKANESYLEIYFRNGSVIAFNSAEAGDALRSYTVSGILVIDEGAMINDYIFSILSPVVNVYRAPIIVCSTPKYRVGWFYDLYVQGLKEEGLKTVYTYDWSDSKYDRSPLLSPEKLEFYRRTLPRDQFEMEYLGIFCDLGAGVFGDFGKCMSKDPYVPEGKIFIGIDWSSGTNNDETAICVFDEKKHMIDLIGFNDKDDLQTINIVLELIQKYHPYKVMVETNSIGQIYYSMLKRKLAELKINTHLCGFTTTNDSKRKIVNRMQVAIQNNEVTLIDDEILRQQMLVFETKLTVGGKVTYAAEGNKHDDRILAMLIAFNSLQTGSYSYA